MTFPRPAEKLEDSFSKDRKLVDVRTPDSTPKSPRSAAIAPGSAKVYFYGDHINSYEVERVVWQAAYIAGALGYTRDTL